MSDQLSALQQRKIKAAMLCEQTDPDEVKDVSTATLTSRVR